MAARPRSKFRWLFITAGVLGIAAILWFFLRPYAGVPPEVPVSAADESPSGISCLGRIQAEDGTITIGARSLSGQPALVGKLLVREGEDIKDGQILAILDSQPQLEAAWLQAEASVKVAQVRRSQVMAGAKTADIAAQEAEIARLEIELANARVAYQRNNNLFKEGIVAQSVEDQYRLPVDTTTRLIAAAKERLRSLTEVRQIDVDVADAELAEAMAQAQRMKVEAEAGTIRSSYNGRILKIHAWEGSEVGPRGILELAKVARMYVIAEVAENDVQRVKVGQRARITGDSLLQPIEGKVERTGLQVSKNSMTAQDPVSLTDARIVEVRILLDDPSGVKNLINAQVEVLITP